MSKSKSKTPKSKSTKKSTKKPTTKAMVVAPKSEGFEWTPEREKALDLVLAGIPKTAIATTLGVHRNTINNWCSHPMFIAAGKSRHREHSAATRQRRHMQTNTLNERIYKLADKAVTQLFDPDVKGQDKRWAREILAEFRSMRAEERQDMGDNVKRVETRGSVEVSVTGDINVQKGSNDSTFRDFLLTSMESSIIDVALLDDVEDTELVAQAMEQALLSGEILDVIDEEDRDDSNDI